MMSLQIQSGIDLQSFLLFIQVNKSILVYLYNYFLLPACNKRLKNLPNHLPKLINSYLNQGLGQ